VSTVLIEQHSAIGTETSSRNSEIIHAGLQYGPDSLKTELCLRGKGMLYALCEEHGIDFRRTGKWIVAQDEEQLSGLEKLEKHGREMGIPVRWVGKEEAKQREPDVRADAGVLESLSTGIVDSHGVMQYLWGSFEDHGGVTALSSSVVRIEPVDGGKGGWDIWTRSCAVPEGEEEGSEEEAKIRVDVLVNSAGLYAVPLANMVWPEDRRLEPRYAKGTYYAYGASRPKTNTLIYPVPVPGHGGLGTHLTLDLGGKVRFGPDLQWISSPTDYVASGENLAAAIEDIKKYLPGIDVDAISVDYCGIRPKLPGGGGNTAGKGFQDFVIRKEDGFTGWVNCLGIESPGLTASLAIGEMVEGLIYD
jgi:2-hydroxyglutarate dehydrogenase